AVGQDKDIPFDGQRDILIDRIKAVEMTVTPEERHPGYYHLYYGIVFFRSKFLTTAVLEADGIVQSADIERPLYGRFPDIGYCSPAELRHQIKDILRDAEPFLCGKS
ncbi:MAG: hypothetical protein IJV54_10865, partial [Bacteroidales bacterium]|nr:hypothetical protein [Bacteroidales bacterium]